MIIRSLLFTPATRLDRMDRALGSGADCVVLDLEDGVGPGDKAAARSALSACAADGFAGHADRLAVRINALATPDGVRDMAAMLDWAIWPGLLVVPKVASRAEIAQIASLAATAGHSVGIVAVVETAEGIQNAASIVRHAPGLAAIAYGSADHTAETGANMDWDGLAWSRGQVVNAAAIAGVPALDGVYLDIRDPEGLARDSARLAGLGFTGRVVIHPDQVGPVNTAFSPTPEEAEAARALLDAARQHTGGAFSHKGKMIDEPVLAAARRVLAAAEANERTPE